MSSCASMSGYWTVGRLQWMHFRELLGFIFGSLDNIDYTPYTLHFGNKWANQGSHFITRVKHTFFFILLNYTSKSKVKPSRYTPWRRLGDRGKILCPCRGSNPDRPVVQPVVRHYTAWANPAPILLNYTLSILNTRLTDAFCTSNVQLFNIVSVYDEKWLDTW
jgi:hypothetical protein